MLTTRTFRPAAALGIAVGFISVIGSGCAKETTPVAAPTPAPATATKAGALTSKPATKESPAEAHLTKAREFIRKGSSNDAKALEEIRKAVRLEPKNREAKYLFAFWLNKLKHKGEAKKAYTELAAGNDQWAKLSKEELKKIR